MHRSSVIAIILAATFLTSCGDDSQPIIAPTLPDAVTEVFTGTLNPLGSRLHAFNVLNAGTVTATLTDIDQPDPDVATVVGLDLGTWTGAICQISVARPNVLEAFGVTGSATSSGSLCVRIWDPNQEGLPATVAYTITVSHY
jgi:hypothetical protein